MHPYLSGSYPAVVNGQLNPIDEGEGVVASVWEIFLICNIFEGLSVSVHGRLASNKGKQDGLLTQYQDTTCRSYFLRQLS